MKADAWECGHRMPFIVRWPEKIKPESTSDQLVCFTDIFATMSEVVGARIPSGQAPDSKSFLSVLLGNQSDAKQLRQQLVVAAGRKHVMIRKGQWKLITGPGSGGFSKGPRNPGPGIPKGQLYNLQDDLGETKIFTKICPTK